MRASGCGKNWNGKAVEAEERAEHRGTEQRSCCRSQAPDVGPIRGALQDPRRLNTGLSQY